MSMLLWKTLALGGVIGVGSVVVVKAQKSLDQDSKVAIEEFELLDDVTGLETSFAGAETGGADPSQPQKFVEPGAVKPVLAADNAVVPEGNPFGGEPAGAEITRAAAEVSDGGDPFAPAQSEPQSEPSQPGTSTVTLDEPAGDQFALLDANASAQAPRQAETDPFAVEPASSSIPEQPGEPLKKLSPGNDGPVLMRTPSDEPAPQPADDNPFAQFLKAPASGGREPAVNEVQPGAPQVDAPPTSFPPLRTREPAEPAATMPLDLPTPRLQPEMSDVPRRRREEAAGQSEPDVATQQDAGLAAPQPPALPEVALENAPGRTRVAEAEIETSATIAAEEPGTFNFPPLDLTAGQNEAGGQRAIPADASSIPNSNSSIPATTNTVPESPSSIPAKTTPKAGDFNPDESSNRPPVGYPASSLPAPGSGERPAAPPAVAPTFDGFPAANEPVSQPPVAPTNVPAAAASPDLSGFGVVDRNFATGPSQPQLTIVKEAPSEAVIGQDLEYSILVKNIGRSAAHNVVVEDLIPRGSKCTGTIPKAESQLEKKNLLWKLGTIAPGAEQLLRVRIMPTDAGEIGSVATVSFSAEVASRTVIVEPKAALVVSGRQDAVVGEPNQYRFVLTNNGPIDLKGVFVRTVLPGEGLTHPGGNDLEYEVGDLPRGKSRDVTLALTPSQPGDWKFQSIVTLGGRELAKAVTDVHAVAARLTVVRSGPTKRFVGRSATYSNTVSNSSTQVLSNVTVVETLPNNLDPSGQLSNNVRWDPAKRTLTWVIPQLGPGQIIDLPCTVTPKIAGNLEGQIVARDASGNHAELATALDVAGFSSLVVDGGHDGTPVAVGDQVSFRFKVKNRGTAAAEQVVASFELPDEVEFISAQGPGNVKFERLGRVVLFDPMPTVPVNTELTYDVVVQAKSVTPANGDKRIGVKLYSTQLPTDRPLEQEQQLVIYGDEEVAQPVQRASGVR